jgi:hypothetical protein
MAMFHGPKKISESEPDQLPSLPFGDIYKVWLTSTAVPDKGQTRVAAASTAMLLSSLGRECECMNETP